MTPTKIKFQNGQEDVLSAEPLLITERYAFVDLLVTGDTPKLVALCARRNLEWVNSLALPSFLELAQTFIRENFKMAMEIALKDPIAGLKVGPLMLRMAAVLNELPEPILPSSPTKQGSPSPASPSSSTTPTGGSMNGSSSPAVPAPAASPAATGSAAAA